MNMTTTDRSAAIRAALKARGWTSRDVSVRTEYFSMGSAIDVTVKNPAVPLATVQEIADAHERIDRCEISGEILSGCNRYVHVSYSHDALAALAATVRPAVDRAVQAREGLSDTSLIPVEGTDYLIGVGRHGHGLAIWHKDSGFQSDAFDANGVAEYIGRKAGQR